jgi:hypothetical protein
MTDSTEDLSGKFLPLEQDVAHPGSPTSQDDGVAAQAGKAKTLV